MSSNISMYKTINNEIYKKLDIKNINMCFSYTKDNEIVSIKLKDEDNIHSFYMGNSDSYWDVNLDDLIIERTFTLGNTKALFGNQGITTSDGELGIGVHIYSRSSNFQTTITLDEVITEDIICKDIKFKYIFKSGEIKGDIYFTIFIYLRKKIKNIPMYANIPGMKLGEIDNFKITVDGDGSIFPIVEVEKCGEPLWKVITDWTDINDTFDTDNVRIEINNKHHMHTYIYKATKPSQYLLLEILSNAIAQIIFKVTQDEDFVVEEESIPDSIRSVVEYWVDTFEVQIYSLETINYSIRKNIESLFIL